MQFIVEILNFAKLFEYNLNIFWLQWKQYIKIFKSYGKLPFEMLTLFEDRLYIQNDVFCKLLKVCSILLFSRQVVSDSWRPHGLQLARLPCPSPSPRICPSSCSLNWLCHPTISSCVALFCFQSFPTSESFPNVPLSGINLNYWHLFW